MSYFDVSREMRDIKSEIRSLTMQKNYPCIAAFQSTLLEEYVVGTYDEIGLGTEWLKLRKNLSNFIKRQKATKSRFLSYWAVFKKQDVDDDEEAFEKKLWQELSMLSSVEEKNTDWGKANSGNPDDPSFCLSLDGEKFFIVGMHPASCRLARRFSRPTLIFNAFSQFETLEREGTYNKMISTIRKRELIFQGSLNSMVTTHGDQWESIQFSGRQNSPSWKCPFRFFRKKDKPTAHEPY